jgi:hypothetical protein
MEIKTEVIFDSGKSDLTYSLRKQRYVIDYAGIKHYIDQPERLAVAPGDFEQVKAFAPELLTIFQAIWTPDIIASYKETISAQGVPLDIDG